MPVDAVALVASGLSDDPHRHQLVEQPTDRRRGAAHLLDRVTAYAAAVATWPEADRQFIPHPATWFNRGSYDDDPATWQRRGATAVAAPREYPGMRPDDPIILRRQAF